MVAGVPYSLVGRPEPNTDACNQLSNLNLVQDDPGTKQIGPTNQKLQVLGEFEASRFKNRRKTVIIAFLELCSFPLFHRPKGQQDQPCQSLHVQRRPDPAEEATLTMPDMLTSLGSQSWMKNQLFRVICLFAYIYL